MCWFLYDAHISRAVDLAVVFEAGLVPQDPSDLQFYTSSGRRRQNRCSASLVLLLSSFVGRRSTEGGVWLPLARYLPDYLTYLLWIFGPRITQEEGCCTFSALMIPMKGFETWLVPSDPLRQIHICMGKQADGTDFATYLSQSSFPHLLFRVLLRGTMTAVCTQYAHTHAHEPTVRSRLSAWVDLSSKRPDPSLSD